MAGGVWSSLVAGSCRRWCRGRQRGSTEAVYRFRKHWPVYTGLEKHAALCHLIARSKRGAGEVALMSYFFTFL